MKQVEGVGWLIRLRVDDVFYLTCKYTTFKVVPMVVWIYNLANFRCILIEEVYFECQLQVSTDAEVV